MSSSCDPFSVAFTGSAQALYDTVKQLIADNNGSISGDVSGGSFSVPLPIGGDVRGTYAVSGQTVSVTVTHKPWLLPCDAIANYVRGRVP